VLLHTLSANFDSFVINSDVSNASTQTLQPEAY